MTIETPDVTVKVSRELLAELSTWSEPVQVRIERIGGEWDMIFRRLDGDPVTLRREDAQRLFDLATDSPLICSGSFETDDVVVLRRLAALIGVDPNVATPDEFAAQYPHPFKRRPVHAKMLGGETGEQAQARIAEERADPGCRVGKYGRWCGKPADDPIHTHEGAPA